jgi:hypothetical protein
MFNFYNFNFLIRQIIKVDIKNIKNKYLEMDGVCCYEMEYTYLMCRRGVTECDRVHDFPSSTGACVESGVPLVA